MVANLLLLSTCSFSTLAFSIPDSLQHIFQEESPKSTAREDARKAPRIAVIGSGITGATAAYSLYESFRNLRRSPDDPLPEITVFERNPIVGGRITQAYAFEDTSLPVDTCAQYFSSQDACISNAARNVGLRPQPFTVPPDVGTAAWNGSSFIGFIEERGFRGPRTWSPFKTTKWFTRYGNIPWEFEGNATQADTSLLQVLRSSVPVPGVAQPLLYQRNISAAVDLIRTTVEGGIAGSCDPQRDDAKTCEQYAKFVADVLDPAANERFFTGAFEVQVPPARLNALAVYRSYEALNGNIVIAGGNLRLIERLLALASANIKVSTEVFTIERLDGPPPSQITLQFRSLSDYTVRTGKFDTVILAAPFQLANITFSPAFNESLSDTLMNNPVKHLDTFVTHFTTTSLLNAAAFDTNLATNENPQRILASSPFTNDAPFVSLRFVKVLTRRSRSGQISQENLFRLVTRSEPPSQETIRGWLRNSAVTGKRAEITWMDVQSLPLSTPTGYGAAPLLEDVEIAPGVIYAGGGEQILGTAEFGCRSGANAAALVVNGLLKDEKNGGGRAGGRKGK